MSCWAKRNISVLTSNASRFFAISQSQFTEIPFIDKHTCCHRTRGRVNCHLTRPLFWYCNLNRGNRSSSISRSSYNLHDYILFSNPLSLKTILSPYISPWSYQKSKTFKVVYYPMHLAFSTAHWGYPFLQSGFYRGRERLRPMTSFLLSLPEWREKSETILKLPYN